MRSTWGDDEMASTETERRATRLAAVSAASDAHARDRTERNEDVDRKPRKGAPRRDAEREMADADDDLYENMPI
jgi:hypothetical protein